MYQFQSRVRYSEVGENQKLTMNSVVNYFQDCSTFQSESLGVGLDYLREKNRAWVLSSWQIVVERYAGLMEEITIGTWPSEFSSLGGSRNFVMKDKEGNDIAYANTLWILIDTESGRPMRVPEELRAYYTLEEKYPMEYAPRKVPVPKEGEQMEAFPVRKHHLDTNHHVNNGQYIEMAKDYLPDGVEIREMRAEYKKSAVLGDMIHPFVSQNGSIYTVALCDENQKPYAVVELHIREESI